MSALYDYDEDVLVQEVESKEYEIVLYNDDVNTFDYVIDTLVSICKHTPIQAEQCAMLVHYKGKCSVKSGIFKELEHKCSLLLDAGLTADIQ
jgi:ATP-dependent Clp protease adaptor protein ClpS